MTQPRFSIVIPTYERHDTLPFSIKTVLAQTFDDFELIISDNVSSPLTKDAVEQFSSEKIRYYRTPRLLAMTNNFEFGVSKATGEYIIVIGDDDGLMPDALENIDRIARQTGEKAIRWESTHYYWPSMPLEEKKSLASFAESTTELRFDGEVVIDNVVNGEHQYAFLPMLYHGAVHKDILASLKERTGSVFKSRSPDIYSGFAVAYVAKHYMYCSQPYSIMGLSGKSNGWAHMMNNNTMMKTFETANKEDAIACHPLVPEIPGLQSATVDSFHCAKDALFPERNDLTYDEKNFLITCLISNYRPQDDQRNIKIIQNCLKKRPQLLKWFNTVAVPNLAIIKTETGFEPPISTSCPSVCDLNVAKSYGIQDIYALTQQYRNIVEEQKRLATP